MIAVIGASGLVGRIFLSMLDEVIALGSKRSQGMMLPCKTGYSCVEDLEFFDFKRASVAVFMAGSEISKRYVSQALEAGCFVIDAASYYRMDPLVPLIIPEINAHALKSHTGLVASPNCTATPLCMTLKPLHDLFTLQEVVATSYQAVSGAGKKAVDQLQYETCKHIIDEKEPYTNGTYAFNIIPSIDVLLEDGSTKEEWKMKVETNKILETNIPIMATCVRVPVYIGHGVAVHVRFKNAVDLEKAHHALRNFPGIHLKEEVVTPAMISGTDFVYVSRLRQTSSHDLALWVVTDNLRKGAALNVWQILETLQFLQKKAV